MRTTVNLDNDVAAALRTFQRERDLGMSEAVNMLVRRALVESKERAPYDHRSSKLGIKLDITHVADALEHLEESDQR